MNLDIISSLKTGKSPDCPRVSDNGEFSELLRSDIARKCSESLVIVSPKFEEAANENPDLYEEIRQKIAQLSQSRDNIIIVDRNGDVTNYSTKKKENEHPTAEELKEVAKARARRQARLAMYFQRLEKVCIKRKLIEQENAKRTSRKKYRSVTELGVIADGQQLAVPPKNPDYFF
ncbi:MAG: hypothetical protein J1F03_11030 [Oscillospiraceae bacterium]|nr:hypothetical protein [Oscillospiraceae bacterium]